MIRHIFLDKTATIIKDSRANTGLNPVVELNYGNAVTRILVHFDETKIKEMVGDKTLCKEDKVRYVLKMTNTAAIDGIPYGKPLSFGNTGTMKERASSFTILAMELPCSFDAGRGFNYVSDVWIGKNKAYTTNGCNWLQATNGKPWDEEGVYSPETIKREYDKFSEGEPSLVIDRQHFDFGDEQLQIDLTEYVKAIVAGEKKNYGILICFTPAFEVLNGGVDYIEFTPESTLYNKIPTLPEMPSRYDVTVPMYFKILDEETGKYKFYHKSVPDVTQQYVGFFAEHTNTFFHPYLEVQYDETIKDDRECFCIGKINSLYLYVNVNGTPDNLDELPKCEFMGAEVDVEQVTKGVYRTKPFTLVEGTPNEIVEDVWSNLIYKGEHQDDVTMETVLLPRNLWLNAGNTTPKGETVVPSLYGINDDEAIKQGDIRQVCVDFREKYTTNIKANTLDGWYRLYVKSGEQEIDILNGYQPLERAYLQDYFMIYSEDLVPNNRYYVDVKIKTGHNELYFKDALHFKVADNITERYV